MEIKIKTIQNYLNELAAELGAVAYRPDYHGKKGDCYTVLFYEKDAEAHNRLVDTQPTRYTRSEARDIMKRYHVSVGPECVYEDYFWAFENSDANGCLSADFANHGQLDLRGPDWRDRLRGAAMLALNRTRDQAEIRPRLAGRRQWRQGRRYPHRVHGRPCLQRQLRLLRTGEGPGA